MVDRNAPASTTRRDAPRLVAESAGPKGSVALQVLGRFDLRVGDRSASLGRSCQRLLAMLAIKGGKINRAYAAGVLWPEVTSARAVANLRSVLWRLQRCCGGVVDPSFYDLRLAPHVMVDLCEVSSAARRLLDRSAVVDTEALKEALRCNLHEDIAPDLGDDEWLEIERERFRQLRVHSLEILAEHLIGARWYGAAIEAAMGAIHSDPFRESAYYLLVKALLAEGSYLEARRQHSAYRQILWNELGLEPSERFMSLLEGACGTPPEQRATALSRSGGWDSGRPRRQMNSSAGWGVTSLR